tara:strand:+ start:136 stop:324 length:189 start_codon:yes stop_codon:yes gene_type:complete
MNSLIIPNPDKRDGDGDGDGVGPEWILVLEVGGQVPQLNGHRFDMYVTFPASLIGVVESHPG